ncbi:hydantoinase B/oxoprolinase family protein [Novacetimonas hansenii]|uniref:hydantoinase B/oxoprolinase family protein n=1 Tax=Novacetimonas hansenii TaxID=436 RepID=UPI00248E0B41|nr:hydantoinase B/oxoprolinase family protein [Novacetimonas hansenii]
MTSQNKNTPPPPTDGLERIGLQVMWDRLLSVVEEQALMLVRTGFSTSTREAGDVSAGIFDVQGRMIAQAVTGTPGHVNSMARAIRHFIDCFPVATMREGDTFITNDPWKGTGHLHDFTVLTPIFRAAKVVAMAASTCHVIDIGGRGMGPEGRTIFEEGLFVPIRYLTRGGEVDQTLMDLIHCNVREPEQVVGDVYSLMGCNTVAQQRFVQMLDEFHLDDIEMLSEHIINTSRLAMLDAIRALPPGRSHYEMYSDGYDLPIRIRATLSIETDGICVDFAGSSPPSRFGINVPFCYTEAYASFGVKCMVAPRVPNNAGSLEVIRICAPEDSILNAPYPLPVATRHIIGQLLPDVVIGCLSQILGPTAVPAEGTSCLWNLFASGGAGMVDVAPAELANARTFNVMSFHSGGTGARPGRDGLSATAFPSGVRNVPVEITESMSPILIHSKEYRTDSGGAGEFRGGLGQVMEVSSTEHSPFTLSANFDRVLHPPRGRAGGMDGLAGRLVLGDSTPLRGKGRQVIPAGMHLTIKMPGGGGIGDPTRRCPERVAHDVRNGLVSPRCAVTLYGVMLDANEQVDLDATYRHRNGMAKAGTRT